MHNTLSNKITDLKRMSDDKKATMMSKTMDVSILDHEFATTSDRKGATSRGGKPFTPNQRKTPQLGNLERPASRAEITSLEQELEERVRLVLDFSSQDIQKEDEAFAFGQYSFQPQRESMMLFRDKLLQEFSCDNNSILAEPWLDNFIKCECLKVMCDEVSSKLSDILSINSIELGNVLRKLRLTYKQTFEQMVISWKSLRNTFLNNKNEVSTNMNLIKQLRADLNNKEHELTAKFDLEIIRLNKEFQNEKNRDLEKLTATEFKMDQMSDTLKYLNGLFKSMQDDTSTVKTGDLASKCYRLERENAELLAQNSTFDQMKMDLTVTEKKLKSAETHIKTIEDELTRLKKELVRRDEAINSLMEKDALRNAEIEKLHRIGKAKDDELINMDLKDPATSVLCVKCRKGLDDLSNIRSAVLGDGSNKPVKIACEEYRILLPNLKGRHPSRSTLWLKSCMRSILLSKLKEDVYMFNIKGDMTVFASYTYAWFHRDCSGLSGTLLTKHLQQCDEDRWALYYGAKILAKNNTDPEATVFYALLDNAFGNDGLQFVLYCLSVILTLGGVKLWRQFGSAFTHGASIAHKRAHDSTVLPIIWLDITLAKEAIKLILVRALNSHVTDALDAVEALKLRPTDHQLKNLNNVENDLPLEPEPEPSPKNAVPATTTSADQAAVTAEDGEVVPPAVNPAAELNEEATHIDLFMWLRLMLQQIHADQIHRNAAIRLMFETASIGALTPQINNYDSGSAGTNGTGTQNTDSQPQAFGASTVHVEYPQFQSICQTLFPYLPMSDIASLYAACYDVGNKRVNAEIFVKQANLKGYFTYALKLPLLPLLKPYVGESSHKQLEDGQTNNAETAVPAAAAGGTEGELNVVISEAQKILQCKGYTLPTEIKIRSKLATIIHRKLAAMMPSLKHFQTQLPEKYRNMLTDAINNVNLSLQDTYTKLRAHDHEQSNLRASAQSSLMHGIHVKPSSPGGTGRIGGNGGGDNHSQQQSYIDGLQPYIYYRRLVTLASFIKSLTDNPIRPEELFHPDLLDNNVFAIDRAVSKAEQLLTSLEFNLILPSNKMHTKYMEKYLNFEHVRKVLITRRLQVVTRKFLNRDVAVPRGVRMLMAPGYLRQIHGNNSNSKLLLKNREVFHEPWYGQVAIAEIYKFKYNYDCKAISLGVECLTLPQAVTAYHYYIYGSVDVADRAIHDLFTCIRAYRLGVPRLRIFAAFLGDGRELDESVAEMLRTPHGFNVYMTLLLEIHKELHKTKREFYARLQATAKNSERKADVDMAKMGIQVVASPVSLDGNNDDNSSNSRVETEVNGADLEDNCCKDPLHIDVLFPSSENTFARLDKREVWSVSVKLVTTVIKRWANAQKVLYGNSGIYTDLLDKLKTNMWGEVEVDDVLYITMIQWTKLTAFHVKKSQSRAALVEKNHLDAVRDTSAATAVTDVNGAGTVTTVDTALVTTLDNTTVDNRNSSKLKPKTHQNNKLLPTLPSSQIKTIVESLYRPGEGSEFVDSQYYSTAYLHRIGNKAENRVVPADLTAAGGGNKGHHGASKGASGPASAFSKEMEKLLKDCVLWDINSTFPVANGEGQSNSNMNTAESAASTVGGKVTTSASAGRVTIRATSPLKKQGQDTEQDTITPVLLSGVRMSLGVNPELTFVVAKRLFTAYQAPANVLVSKVTETPHFASNPEIARKLQSVRILILNLSDLFSHSMASDQSGSSATSTGAASGVEYYSYKLYVYEATAMDRYSEDERPDGAAQRILDEFNQNEYLTSGAVNAIRALRNQALALTTQAWSLMEQLVTSLADLAISVGEEFPRDAWQVGVKMHVDRSFVYNIHTKNSIQ